MKNDNQAIHLIEPRSRQVGSGTVRRLLPHHSRRMVGPFIFADLIGPETLTAEVGVDVDAHLHIGLATVTYLLAGRLVHRDSTGVVQTIEPGAVNGMTAGSGWPTPSAPLPPTGRNPCPGRSCSGASRSAGDTSGGTSCTATPPGSRRQRTTGATSASPPCRTTTTPGCRCRTDRVSGRPRGHNH